MTNSNDTNCRGDSKRAQHHFRLASERPLVSVVVATRNRPRDLARFLESAMQLTGVPFEILIADQSDDGRSESISAGFEKSGCLRYLRCEPRGKSYAVNRAAGIARGAILALTDDDCTPGPDWLHVAVATLAERPYLDLLFGEFVPIKHDPKVDFIPRHHIEKALVYRTVPSAAWAAGLGGNTVITTKAFLAVGGMDERIGPGAFSRSGNDCDLNYRVVDAGYVAADVPALIVRHWGARKWADGSARRLIKNNFFGQGVIYAKRVKCGDLRGFQAIWQQTAAEVTTAVGAAIRLRRPSGLGRLSAMYWGFIRAMVVPVDQRSRKFSVPKELGSEQPWPKPD